MPEGALRVPESDRGEPGRRLVAAQGEALLRQCGNGGQQRPVKQPLVQAAHRKLGACPLLGELCGARGKSGRSRESAQRVWVARHQVGPTKLRKLQPVFEQSEEPVVARKLRRLRATDVPVLGQCAQGVQRAGLADIRIGLAVHQLQKLDGELHVPQATRSELELEVELLPRDVRGHPLPHPLHPLDEVLPRCAAPHPRRHRSAVPLPQFQVAGKRPGLQQGLELPALGPAVVVRNVRLESAHERPVLALRPEVRVHLPQRGFFGGVMDAPHRGHGEFRRNLHGPVAVCPFRGFCHEDDVDVAHVVQLGRTCLAHTNDRQPRGRNLLRRKRYEGACDRERGIKRRGGQVRESGRDGVHAGQRIVLFEVERGEPGQVPAIAHPQRVPGRVIRPIHIGNGSQQLRPVLRCRQRLFESGPQRSKLLGMPGEKLAEPRGCAEHTDQPPRPLLRPEQCRGLDGRLPEQVNQESQRLVRVCTGREIRQHRFHPMISIRLGQESRNGTQSGETQLRELRESRLIPRHDAVPIRF